MSTRWSAKSEVQRESAERQVQRVSAERQVQTRNTHRTQTRSVVATTCGSMGYRLFRRPQVLFLCVSVFVCLGLCDCEFVGLWGCEFVGVWISVLWVCVCVCVCVCSHVCVCLGAVCFYVIV